MSAPALSSIGQSIEILCNEQGLDRDMVIEAMKDAVRAAARKQFKDKTGDSVQVDWNNEEGVVEISAQKTVVLEVEDPLSELSLTDAQEMAGDEIEVGDMLLLPLPTEELGRIAHGLSVPGDVASVSCHPRGRRSGAHSLRRTRGPRPDASRPSPGPADT